MEFMARHPEPSTAPLPGDVHNNSDIDSDSIVELLTVYFANGSTQSAEAAASESFQKSNEASVEESGLAVERGIAGAL